MQTICFSFKGFLKAFTSDSVVEGALRKQYFIEEEDIETVPENVPGYMLKHINDELLSSARQYFTEDAWMCLSNTLDVIKGKIFHILFLCFKRCDKVFQKYVLIFIIPKMENIAIFVLPLA